MSVNIVPGKGFQLTFENGRTLSCMFGYGNYCENRHARYLFDVECGTSDAIHASADFEIAAWNEGEGRPWVNFGCDEVRGWLDLEQVVEFARWLRGSDKTDLEYHFEPKGEQVAIRLSTNMYFDAVSVQTDNGTWTSLFWSDSTAEEALAQLELCLEHINGENR